LKKLLLVILISNFINAAAIAVNCGGTLTLKLRDPIIKIINTKKQVAYVSLQDEKRLFIKGLKPGVAFIHYWDKDNKQGVYKVLVRYVKKRAVKKAVKRDKGLKYDLYFSYDPEQAYELNKRLLEHKISYKTSIGKYSLDMLIVGKNRGKSADNNIEELDTLKIIMSDQRTYLIIGDNTIRYTDLLANYLNIQGGRFKSKYGVFDKQVDVDLFVGYEVGRLWGYYNREDAAVGENNTSYLGAKIGTDLIKNRLKCNVATVSKLKKYSDDHELYPRADEKTEVNSLSFNYGLDKNSSVDVEIAASNFKRNILDKKTDSALIKYKYFNRNLSLLLKYKDIDPGHRAASHFMPHLGAQGVFIYGSYKPFNYLGVSGRYNKYTQRFDEDFTPSNNSYVAENMRYKFTWLRFPYMKLVPSLSLKRSLGVFYLMEGYSLDVDQIMILKKRLLSGYIGYDVRNYVYNRDALSDGDVNQTKIGLRSRLLDKLSLRLEHVSEEAVYKNGPDDNPRGFNFVANYGSFEIPGTNIKSSCSYWYQNRLNSQGTADKNNNAVKLSFTQQVNSDFYWYLNGVYSQEHSLKYEYEDENNVGYFFNDDVTRSQLSGGINYIF